jgi:hypothetical protein
MTSCSKGLGPRLHPKHPLQITTRTPKGPDFKFELLPLHSPLLRQSLLVSFPPLIDMLKFSGYSRLIRGQPYEFGSRRPTDGARARDFSCYAQDRTSAPTGFGPVRKRRGPSPSRARGLKWRSNRRAPRNTRGRNVRSKIR